jgi:hypothetical protein
MAVSANLTISSIFRARRPPPNWRPLDKVSAAGGHRYDGASGSALDAAKTRRIVIVATKSGTEKNATVFPRYLLKATIPPLTLTK